MITLALFAALSSTTPSAETTHLIANARLIVQTHGDRVWPGLSHAPDTIILIESEQEFLLCHEGPAQGFHPVGREPETGCDLRVRDRTFPPSLLASFPAVDGTPSIVMGTPDATGRTPDDWMITVLHERFHQLQDSQPDSFQRALALDLHAGDQTGMWMLNYPFPYQSGPTAH